MKGHPEIEIERRWGNGERCREGEKKKREKSLWCGDEKETEIVWPASYHHHLPTTIRPLPDFVFRYLGYIRFWFDLVSQYTKNFWEYLDSINFVFDFGLILGYL